MGFLYDIGESIGKVVGTAVGIATAPIAIALGVSEAMVKSAVRAGCTTKKEIEDWIEENT